MLPRKIIIVINVLAIKLVLSQTVYSATPTTYTTNTVPTAQSFPTNVSPSATVTTIPASTVTATPIAASPVPMTASPVSMTASPIPMSASPVPMTASPVSMTASPVPVTATVVSSNIPIATIAATVPKSSVSSMPTATVSASSVPCSTVAASYMSSPVASPKSSSATEVKAYFLPGPVPDPKVTVLAGDMPSIVEVKPRIADPGVIEVKSSRFADAGIVEVSPVCAGPGYIEVTGTFCPDAIKTSNVQVKTMSSTQGDNSPMTPVKRLATACANDDPFKSPNKSPFLPNQQPVCPGISKMDLIPTVQKTAGNPIDFDGLLDSFMTCL